MATQQPLKGGSNKIYDVITNFSKGIDKKVADDIALDSSFKELKNFYNANEGYLSKRPGVYNSKFFDFISALCEGYYDTTKFEIKTNRFNETSITVLQRLNDFKNTVINQEIKEGNEDSNHRKLVFYSDKIIGFQIYKNNSFFEAMQNYDELLAGESVELFTKNEIEIGVIIVSSGIYGLKNTSNNKEVFKSKSANGLYIARLNITITDNGVNSNYRYSCSIEMDEVDSTMNPSITNDDVFRSRWDISPELLASSTDTEWDTYMIQPALTVDLSNYNGNSYIATGTDYIIKIDQIPESKKTSGYAGESNIITKIGGTNEENIYRPTAIELQQIGFNILANKPLTYYNNTGIVSKTKGVFYSITPYEGATFKQPVTKVPYNAPFFMHIIYTGTNKPQTPQYRQDNGETDVSKNPYNNLPGEWTDSTKTIWRCTGIDSDQKFEIKIALENSNDEFITYVNTTSVTIDETGYIDEISELVFSSTHSKIINNQLVLYGGHGYIFFSEFDRFDYFPNYYFIYISNEAGEEDVTNISYFRQFYAIFTNKRIKKMSGAFGTDNFTISSLSDYIGCPNGRTVKALGNNLLFLGNDGLYELKQGYLGEGTENVEKIDEALNGMLNLSNVIQAFSMNNTYIVVKNDGHTWVVYNTQTKAFYEYNLENSEGTVYKGTKEDNSIANKALPFYSIFQSTLYDANGDFMIVPMYRYNYNDDYTETQRAGCELMLFRFNDLDFLNENEKHKDGYGFISKLETHFMNMGYPTHTKKFKSLYIKLINDTGYIIPLYITVMIDDAVIISPSKYVVKYDEDLDTYYYVEKIENNSELVTGKVLGEFVLGKDKLGNRTIQQIKIKIGEKGRAIKIILSDGFNDYTDIIINNDKKGIPIRNRNIHNFSLSTVGIVYKLKKVKEG